MKTQEQAGLIFSKNYEIKSYEVTANDEIKPFVLLHYLEDMAAVHAESLNFGRSATSEKNIAWFVLKYHMKFQSLPKAWEQFKITTWPRKSQGIQCIRDFEIFSQSGEKIGIISSAWVLVSIENKRPLNPYKTLDFPELPTQVAFDTKFPAIKPVEHVDFEKTFEIRYDDIDINQHVNNANYIAWATETLPYDFRNSHLFSEIEIYYKKECTYGTKVLSQVEYDIQNNTTFHILRDNSTNEELCLIKIQWKRTD